MLFNCTTSHPCFVDDFCEAYAVVGAWDNGVGSSADSAVYIDFPYAVGLSINMIQFRD